MFRITACIFILLISLLQNTVYATSADATLKQLLGNTQTMQADFVQTILDKKGKTLQQSRGHMALDRPGQFRWQVTQPTAQLIIANHSRLWIYDPDLQQVTIQTLSNEVGETPALLLSNGSATLTQDFHVQLIQGPDANSQWFLLIPKKQNTMFASIKLGFVQSQVRVMQLKDNLGHNTVIEFQHIKLNETLSPASFNFKPPRNVDVIDETKR